MEEKKFKEGFDLADTDKNKKLSWAEDTAANLLGAAYAALDTYTPESTGFKWATLTKANTPVEKADGKVDRWELNSKYPMWEVDNLLKTYGGTAAKELTIL